jgi:excisionase family DNA binding protein
MPEEQVYTRQEAQKLLNVSSDTLLNWIKAGYITPVRGKGRGMFFDYWDVTRLVGMKGRWTKNKQKLFDKRDNRATLQEIMLD